MALPGDDAARLLAGPRATEGAESLEAHLERLGPLPYPPPNAGDHERQRARELVRESGLQGRGGGEFPVASKLDTAARAGGDPLVVANGSEGEPASRKDRTLLELRPHLILDGATFAAGAIGGGEVLVYIEPRRTAAWNAIRRAIEERRHAGLFGPSIRLVAAPAAYVAGESSAVVAAIEHGTALPSRRSVPVACQGVAGRPTVVSNVESLANLGLIARFGPAWWREAGSAVAPGSTLVTLAGSVAVPGLVVELLGPVPGGQLLAEHGGIDETPAAVLVGGYAGRWVPGAAFAATPLDRGILRSVGVGLGCGVVAPLPPQSCGLATTLRLLEYLAGESAGQCGPCVFGLPSLAAELEAIWRGTTSRRAIGRLHAAGLAIVGNGACGHPDGAVALLESALDVFADDAVRHTKGQPCHGSAVAGWFPVPRRATASAPIEDRR
jgi:NADH:ubiquinone oxidoreductase subunit F (NADH-binding)